MIQDRRPQRSVSSGRVPAARSCAVTRDQLHGQGPRANPACVTPTECTTDEVLARRQSGKSLSAACECEAQSALQRLRLTVIPSYTEDVKTAISLPDDTYEQASKRAAELGISRSEFFARAARRYLDELASQSLTRQIDEALQAADDDSNAAAAAAGRSYLAGQDDW